MVYKVLYQLATTEVPVRERTKSLYIEAGSEREVREKLIDRNYNIEFIHQLNEAHLAYEQASEHYVLEQI